MKQGFVSDELDDPSSEQTIGVNGHHGQSQPSTGETQGFV